MKRALGPSLLMLCCMVGCKSTFDHAPYDAAKTSINAAHEQALSAAEDQQAAYTKLVDHYHEMVVSEVKIKLLRHVLDSLPQTPDPGVDDAIIFSGAEIQAYYFKHAENPATDRMKYELYIQALNKKFAITTGPSNSTKTYYYAYVQANVDAEGEFSEAEKALYLFHKPKFEKAVYDLPLLQRLESQKAKLQERTAALAGSWKDLAAAHQTLELEMLQGMREMGSALADSAWIVRIATKVTEVLNQVVGKIAGDGRSLSDSADASGKLASDEAKSDETKAD